MKEQPAGRDPQLSEEEAAEILRSLWHKEGNWVNWGEKCQRLQAAGYDSGVIFERTGFQGSQQNLVIVAARVFDSLVRSGAGADLLSYYEGPRGDVLYEFRVLTREQRLAAALLGREKKIDADEAREIARAIQEFSRLAQVPSEFSHDPADAVAYQCWKRGRQQRDLAERAKTIAKGLKYARSTPARAMLESLLQDFGAAPGRGAPLLPLHRLQGEEELARAIPLAGRFPITAGEIAAVATVAIEEPFRAVTVGEGRTLVPLPGWRAILKARDPVAILWPGERLPRTLAGKPEEVLVVVDRVVGEWDENRYYLVEAGGAVSLEWIDSEPDTPPLGELVLILRAKNILDEGNITEPWQMDD